MVITHSVFCLPTQEMSPYVSVVLLYLANCWPVTMHPFWWK